MNIDFNNIIKEITFDPWMPQEKVNGLTNLIKESGFQGNINQSDMYKQPSVQLFFPFVYDELIRN